jgi:type IV secretion system protein VirD4
MNRRAGSVEAKGRLASEWVGGLAFFVGAYATFFVWLLTGLSTLSAGHRFRAITAPVAIRVILELVVHHRLARSAWPKVLQPLLPPGAAMGAIALVLLVVQLGSLALVRRAWGRAARRAPTRGAHWARVADLDRLVVSHPVSGRLALGEMDGHLLAAERGHSVLVLGPTQSGKTSGFAIPALLEWQGPVLATSVKGDLLSATFDRRAALGPVSVYDPTGMTDHLDSGWSPLDEARSWVDARRLAASLCSGARVAGGMEDAAFWYAMAEKLIAPVLLAAALRNGSLAEVSQWLDTEEEFEVVTALAEAGEMEALRSVQAIFGRDERQRSSVFATAQSVLDPFADPGVIGSSRRARLRVGDLLDGGTRTLFVVAPSFEQERLQPVFTTFVKQVIDAAFSRAAQRGRPLDPPLLVVLDEAANIAPLRALDSIAATASAHGIQIVSIWQDVAQINARYGSRAETVLSNHRAKLVCSGIGDGATLETMATLIGEEEASVASTTINERGMHSRTSSVDRRRLAPADLLRRIEPNHAVLVYGHLPPAIVRLRPYFADKSLRAAACGFGRRWHPTAKV